MIGFLLAPVFVTPRWELTDHRRVPRAVDVFGLDLTALSGADRGSCGRGESGIDRADSDDPALLIYTSGTTGHPKAVLLTHGNIFSSATAVNLAWRWQPEDRLVLALPLFHAPRTMTDAPRSTCPAVGQPRSRTPCSAS